MNKNISLKIHYGDKFLDFKIPEEQLLFVGEMQLIAKLENLIERLQRSFIKPVGCRSLDSLIKHKKKY